MVHTRHSLQALLMTKTPRRRSSLHREPSALQIGLGLCAFVAVLALLLFFATVIGG